MRLRRTRTKREPKPWGLLAKFNSQEELVRAARRVVAAGYKNFDAYSPYPIEGLPRVMRLPGSYLPFIMLFGGVAGALIGYFGQAFATVIDYALNIGGRPLLSWPAYIPITFEMTVLFSAFSGVFGLFYATRFPQPYHPVFNSDDFNEHASQDAFYLDIEAKDPQYKLEETRNFLESLGAVSVSEIEA